MGKLTKPMLCVLTGLLLVGTMGGCYWHDDDDDGYYDHWDWVLDDAELRIRNQTNVTLEIEFRPIENSLFFDDHWDTLDHLHAGESDRFWLREVRLRAIYNGFVIDTFTQFEADDTWVITGGP